MIKAEDITLSQPKSTTKLQHGISVKIHGSTEKKRKYASKLCLQSLGADNDDKKGKHLQGEKDRLQQIVLGKPNICKSPPLHEMHRI